MDASFSRLSILPGGGDRHGWNSWDHYRSIHERRLAEHTFVDRSKPHTLIFEESTRNQIVLHGQVFCFRNVTLEVEKWFETRHIGLVRQVRCYSYRYVGWIQGGELALKYHNLHENPDDYIHRVYNLDTGSQLLFEVLQRHQFPVFNEVLDELERAVGCRRFPDTA